MSKTALQTAELNAVYNLYTTVLGRGADASGAAYWANQLAQLDSAASIAATATAPASSAITSLASQIASSGEAKNTVLPVFNLFEALLGRAPDASAISFYNNQVQSGTSLTAIATSIANSTEFTNLYKGVTGTALSNAIVTNFYNNGLARSADSNGFSYWTDYLSSKGNSVSTIVSAALGFSTSAEAVSSTSTAGIRATSFEANVGSLSTLSLIHI